MTAVAIPTTIQQAPSKARVADTTGLVPVRRRTIDKVLVGIGALAVVVMASAGGLLTWGSGFSSDYVKNELTSQRVYFPDEAALLKEGRTDLVSYAGEQVSTGAEAQAYASYIAHHLEGIADGATYADLGAPEREAKAAVTAATDSGASADEVATLQAKATALTAQRDTLFKGETLRGLLLTSYAWDTVGRVAGIAAVAAFGGAGVMALLVALGVVHYRKTPKIA